MKKLLATLALLACLTLPVAAQTNPPVTMQTNMTTITIPQFFTEAWDTMLASGLTNLSVTTYGTYTPSIKTWGAGVVVTRNIPIGGGVNTGIGLGIDYYDTQWYAVNAQVGLNADMAPLSAFGGFATNLIVTPFTFIGIGTPFGSQTAGTAGNLETIVAGGAILHVAQVLGGQFGIGGAYGTRSGLGQGSGVFYGALLDLCWKF